MKRRTPDNVKRLFVGVSVALPLDDAVVFRRTLGNTGTYYLLKVRDSANDVHVSRRKQYVVLREPRPDEVVPFAWRVFAKGGDVIPC